MATEEMLEVTGKPISAPITFNCGCSKALHTGKRHVASLFVKMFAHNFACRSRSRPNGATQTFRRPSANTTAQPRDTAQANPAPSSNSGTYIHPHHNSNNALRNGVSGGTRYSRDEALEIYRRMSETQALDRDLPTVFQGSWDPSFDADGALAQTPRGDPKEQYPGPEVCWESKPVSSPFGLRDFNDEEKDVCLGATIWIATDEMQLFSSSVNSPIKLAQGSKDAGGAAPIGTRKTSLSSYTTGGTASRPGTRRRDTSDSFTANGPMSPAGDKTFFRGESNTATPPPALLRRRTDFKDDEPSPGPKDVSDKSEEDPQAPFGSLRRVGTGPLSAGLNPPVTSPWAQGPNSSAFGSMGSFGSFNVGASNPVQEKAEQRPGFGSGRGSSRFKDMMAKSSIEDMHAGKDKNMFGGLEKLPEEEGDPTQGRMRDLFKTRPNRSETNPYEELPIRTGSAALSQEGSGAQQGMEQVGFAAVGGPGFNEPMSPTHTNPYQSPHGVQRDDGSHEADPTSHALPPIGGARRGLFSDDGSQRSASGFGGFPGFGAPPGPPSWSGAPFGSGTPARDRSMGFGDPIFSPLTDMQSPGAGLGSGLFGGGFGSVGRSARLGGMLPQGMQDPMRGDSRNEGRPFDRPDSASLGRDPFDNGFGRGSGAFDDAGNREAMEAAFTQAGGSSAAQQPGIAALAAPGDHVPSGADPSQQAPVSGNGSMPAAQQRTMVMPDRMRWIYQDPQGNVQGPWSGLEMHDWFKAGFFTAELLVKKLEDTDFEPLAQLVRRIGNSREPFLVPQIGVPHGPPSGGQTSWPNAPQPTPGNAQPPFASAFPSFGTTLTAEQQNALERRKQEEQYLMARQKEHLAQQQMAARGMPMGGPSMHSLQHHSSAQSLHSQPSYGSITSPSGGFHPSPMPPGPPPQSMQQTPIGQAAFSRDENLPNFMDRMSLNQVNPAGPLGAPGDGPSQQQMSQMLQDRARLQQQPVDGRVHQDAFLGQQGRNERLEEFNELRGQIEEGRPGPESVLAPIGAQRAAEEQAATPSEVKPGPIGQPAQKPVAAAEPSLTEQVQWTAAQQQQLLEQEPVQAPPVSISPLPAPAAQRNRQHVAESLVPESRSQSQTPVETPATSVAPWAERATEHRGPSLKEIQEAEAKKAAEQAALVEAARQAQAEQERQTVSHVVPPAPGLPASATWGTSSSPGTPTATSGSVWAKPAAKTGATPNGPAKKTLAQIQKEEEARKQRATAAAAAQVQAQAASSPVSGFQGKRYAELASKAATAVPAPPGPGNAWTTVGQSGKAKAPPTIIATPQGAPRSVSSTASATPRPSLPASRNSAVVEKTKAKDEFIKWAKAKIGKGLDNGINGKLRSRMTA